MRQNNLILLTIILIVLAIISTILTVILTLNALGFFDEVDIKSVGATSFIGENNAKAFLNLRNAGKKDSGQICVSISSDSGNLTFTKNNVCIGSIEKNMLLTNFYPFKFPINRSSFNQPLGDFSISYLVYQDEKLIHHFKDSFVQHCYSYNNCYYTLNPILNKK